MSAIQNKFYFTVLASLLIASSLFATPASADHLGSDYNQFAQLIREATSAGTMKNDVEVRILFNAVTPDDSALNDDVITNLRKIALEQAQVWADTILEGEFAADGKTDLDRVEGLYLNEQLIAYRIIYSERAWHLGQCEDYDGLDYSSCFEGRILEASYVSPTMSTWLRDDQSYATFH